MTIKSDLVEVHVFRENAGALEFLLLKRGEEEIYPGLWQMVTGKTEPGETSVQAALRELKEETGMIPQKFWVVPNINQFYLQEDESINLIPVFAALVSNGDTVRMCDEHCECGWHSPEETKSMLAWEGQRKSVDIIVHYFINQKTALDMLQINL